MINVRYTTIAPGDKTFEDRRPIHLHVEGKLSTLCGINLRQGYQLKKVDEPANCKACLKHTLTLNLEEPTSKKTDIKIRKRGHSEQPTA